VQRPAPDFSLPALNGGQIELAKFRGKVVVLDFWATWCTGCLEALPHLQSIASDADMAQRGLVMLAVNEEEKPQIIRPLVDGMHFTLNIARDADGSEGRAYSVFSLPTTIVVGRDGMVKAVINGWVAGTARQIDEAVSRALAAPIR